MNLTVLGFWLAAAYNACIIIFSKGFAGDMEPFDPLFASAVCASCCGVPLTSHSLDGTKPPPQCWSSVWRRPWHPLDRVDVIAQR